MCYHNSSVFSIRLVSFSFNAFKNFVWSDFLILISRKARWYWPRSILKTFSKYSAITFKSEVPLLKTPSVCNAYKSSISATLEPVQDCFTLGFTCET